MKSILVNAPSHSYHIFVGEGIRHRVPNLLPRAYKSVFILTDENVAPLYLDDVIESFGSEVRVASHIIPEGESSKSFEKFEECHTAAMKHGLDRHSLIIALGGGVVGDLAGFVAATFMRGIDYIQVPTTVLAHDSSVGGKVAINHPLAKNTIGNFYQPEAVVYDTETLTTLPDMEWRSGMAEVIKHAWIHDQSMLQTCFELEAFSDESRESIEHLLWKGISIKANIVAKDEKEHGVRSFLNFGHTLGHALESEYGYGSITHGEAVALGIDFALFLSERYVQDVTLPRANYRKWLRDHNYPVEILQTFNIDSVVSRMKHDKKNKNDLIRFVLLSSIGNPILHPFEEATLREELEVYKQYWVQSN